MEKKDINLETAISRYISSKSSVLSPSTIYGYKKTANQYMQEIMKIPIKKLDQEILQNAVNQASLLYSPKTVRNAYGLIHATLQMFRPEFIIKISLPQKIKPRFYVPDEKEIKDIYSVIKGNPLEIPFLLASNCGLRPSEICALTKDCIYKGKIEIRKAIVVDENGNEVLKPPKTFSGYRSIPISDKFEKMLLKCEGDKICTLSSNKISRDWHTFLEKAGFNVFRFYSLRHYFASQALLLGIPQKYIAEMMGHSSTDMIERVYQHTFPTAMEKFKQQICLNTDKLLR